MEKLYAVTKQATSIVIIPESDDAFETPLQLNVYEDRVSISPFSGDEKIDSITNLVDTLIEVQSSEENTFNFDAALLDSLNCELEEIAPAIHTLSEHAQRLNLELSEVVDVVRALLRRFTPNYIVNKISSASYGSVDNLLTSSETFDAFDCL